MNKKNLRLVIHLIICVLIYAVVSNLPCKEPLTPLGLQVLGIVGAAVYGWCTIDTVIPSIAAVLAYGFVTPNGIAMAFLSGAGSYLIMMILSALLICGIMVHSGLARVLALKIVGSKLANGRPWMLTFLLLLAAGVLSLFIPGLAVVLVVWDIAYGVFEVCGFEKGEKYPAVALVGICAAATFGMVCSHISTGVIPNVAIIQAIDPSLSLNSVVFTVSSIVCLAIFLVLSILLMKLVFRPDVSKLMNYKSNIEAPKFNTDQKRAIVIVAAWAILITLPDILPACGFTAFLSRFGFIGWAFACVLISLLIRNKDGSSFITLKQITDAGVYWEMLIMLASIQVVCGALGDTSLGISDWLIQLLMPIIDGLGHTGIILVMMLICLIVTNLIDNAVTTFVFTYILYTVCSGAGINIMGAFAILLHVSCFGMLLPASCPTTTLLYGKVPDGWVQRKDILKAATPYMVLAYVVYVAIGLITLNMY